MFAVRGLYLTYSSLNLTKLYDEIGYRYSTGGEVQREREVIKRAMQRLYQEVGIPLFRSLKTTVSRETTTSLAQGRDRHNITTGLQHFILVCGILEKFETALEICNFVLDHLEQRATPQRNWFANQRTSLVTKIYAHVPTVPLVQSQSAPTITRSEGTYRDFQDHCIVSRRALRDLLLNDATPQQKLEEHVKQNTQSITRLMDCWRKNPELLRAFDEVQKQVVVEYLNDLQTACEGNPGLDEMKNKIDEFNTNFLSNCA